MSPEAVPAHQAGQPPTLCRSPHSENQGEERNGGAVWGTNYSAGGSAGGRGRGRRNKRTKEKGLSPEGGVLDLCPKHYLYYYLP